VNRNQGSGSRENFPVHEDALEILKKHYASGEITREQFGQMKKYLNSGYSKTQLMKVLVGVAHKTLSNYLNHIAGTPLDVESKKYK